MAQTSEYNGHKFKPGDEIQCISDPSRIGVVVEICELHAGVQWYRVNFGGGDRPKMPEPDLRPFVPTDKPCDNLISGNIDGYREFQRLINITLPVELIDRVNFVCVDKDMTIQEFVTDAIIEKLGFSYKERRKRPRL